MCDAGRILHHLRNNIEDPRNTVLITGYQAENTLGRKLVDKWTEVRIFGEPLTVRAEIASLDALSGHGDYNELIQWVRPIAPALRRIFLVHSEPEQSQPFAELLSRTFQVPAAPAQPLERFELKLG